MQLLTRNTEQRLGCRQSSGLKDLQAHPWFKTIDWDLLEAKQITPPFVPDVSDVGT